MFIDNFHTFVKKWWLIYLKCAKMVQGELVGGAAPQPNSLVRPCI